MNATRLRGENDFLKLRCEEQEEEEEDDESNGACEFTLRVKSTGIYCVGLLITETYKNTLVRITRYMDPLHWPR